MFGLSLASQLFQGSRTWNCVSNFFNIFWTKFNHIRSNHTMPRSRKRHHSRSRSRSRSHSHDRRQDDKYSSRKDSYEKERDGGKRRKIESYDSPTHHKRSVSCELIDDDHRIEDGSGQENGAIQIETKSPISRNDSEIVDSDLEVKESENQSLKDGKKDDNTKEKSKGKDTSETESSLGNFSEKSDISPQKNSAESEKEPQTKENLKDGDGESKTSITDSNEKSEIVSSQKSASNDESEKDNQIKENSKDCDSETKTSMEDSNEKSENISSQKSSSNDESEKDHQTEENSKGEMVEIDESESELDTSMQVDAEDSESVNVSLNSSIDSKALKKKLEITPKKVLSPRQVQKRLESEKKRQEKERQRLERQKQKDLEKQKLQEEKQKLFEQKQKEKEAKEEQKRKEREEKEEQKRKEREEKEEQKRKEREEKEERKRKELEEKEQKRKEKEEKEEMKRKEKEQERLKKLQEIEEKNKEKLKQEEQKQKAAAAFANFFVANNKKAEKDEINSEPEINTYFKAFEIKSDMKLPPPRRDPLTEEEKDYLINIINKYEDVKLYLDELKSGKPLGKCGKTWPYVEDVEEDIVLVDDTLGETICEDEDAQDKQRFRAKFLKFHENRRPAYFGTWRKKSKHVKARKPFGQDTNLFNYEEDSDDDWEEEEQGESINGSDDEDKENEEDDYEVDNEFLVPHGHLSEDEVDDEDMAKLSPESMKQKLKLLKDEFDQEIKSKTHKLKPRSLGCIWYNKDGSIVDPAIDRCLKPLAIITNGNIMIKKRSLIFAKKAKTGSELEETYIPDLLKIIHKNVKNRKIICEEFMTEMLNKGVKLEVSKAKILKLIKQLASWSKFSDEATQKNKLCWIVNDAVLKKYNLFQ